AGFSGDPGTPGTTDGGILGQPCAGQGTGSNGSIGTSPAPGPGAATTGVLTENAWTPSFGTDGQRGQPGSGGGGGAGNGGAGGGGGAGGCGGAGGSGGEGGGASIALAVHESTVSLTGCSLEAKNAGGGGNGAAGQPGQTIFGIGGN